MCNLSHLERKCFCNHFALIIKTIIVIIIIIHYKTWHYLQFDASWKLVVTIYYTKNNIKTLNRRPNNKKNIIGVVSCAAVHWVHLTESRRDQVVGSCIYFNKLLESMNEWERNWSCNPQRTQVFNQNLCTKFCTLSVKSVVHGKGYVHSEEYTGKVCTIAGTSSFSTGSLQYLPNPQQQLALSRVH
jgi:hypothetical protein